MEQTILFVDDSIDKDMMGDLLKEFFTDIGYNPIICGNAEDAITHINKADLLITDFHMPGMNGDKLTKIAKREKPDMPVIIMTCTPWDIPVDHLADKVQVIEKPFKIEQFEKVIADLLR